MKSTLEESHLTVLLGHQHLVLVALSSVILALQLLCVRSAVVLFPCDPTEIFNSVVKAIGVDMVNLFEIVWIGQECCSYKSMDILVSESEVAYRFVQATFVDLHIIVSQTDSLAVSSI